MPYRPAIWRYVYSVGMWPSAETEPSFRALVFSSVCSPSDCCLDSLPSHVLALLVGTLNFHKYFSGSDCPLFDRRDIEEFAVTIKTNSSAILDRWLIIVCHVPLKRDNTRRGDNLGIKLFT